MVSAGQQDRDGPPNNDTHRAAGTPGIEPVNSALVTSLRLVNRLRNLLIVGIFAIMIVTYFTVFSSRYLPMIGAVNWAEELTRYLNIWLLFLSIGYVVRSGHQITMDVFIHLLPLPAQRGLRWVNDGLLLVFLAVLCVYGLSMVQLNMTQDSPSLKLIGMQFDFLMGWPVRMGWPYLAIPVGAILTALDLLSLHVDPDLRRKEMPPEALTDRTL